MDETQVGSGPIDLTRGSLPTGSLAGTTLGGRYRLDRIIGAGGMAQVWEGTDSVLGRRVAVKVLHPHLADDESLVRRFRQEAIAAARLNDPGIVGVYDTCSDDGHEAIVMELLQATTLHQLIDERGTIDPDTTLRIGLRLLDALFRQVGILPAGEQVFQVPLALAVAHENENAGHDRGFLPCKR